MPRETRIVPDFRTLLCENCGYNLTGLPVAGRCPECGHEIAESLPERRQPALVERTGGRLPYLRTVYDVLRHPARFYRSLSVSHYAKWDRSFGHNNWAISSLMLGTGWFLDMSWGPGDASPGGCCYSAIFALVIYAVLYILTRLAVWLTAWEARFRGLRLPAWLVLRGMYFHSAHYLPVAAVVLLTIIGYHTGVSSGWIDVRYGPHYVVLQGVEMLLAAWYLFRTYWTAMRNLMYANGSPPV